MKRSHGNWMLRIVAFAIVAQASAFWGQSNNADAIKDGELARADGLVKLLFFRCPALLASRT